MSNTMQMPELPNFESFEDIKTFQLMIFAITMNILSVKCTSLQLHIPEMAQLDLLQIINNCMSLQIDALSKWEASQKENLQ